MNPGQSMLRLWVPMKALYPPAAGGGDYYSGGWSLSSPDDQYPTGQHATATPCSWRTSFLILPEFRILGWSHGRKEGSQEAHRLNSYDSREWEWEWEAHLVLILEIMECEIFCTWVVKSKIPTCYTNKQASATQGWAMLGQTVNAQKSLGGWGKGLLGRDFQVRNEMH